METLAIAPRTPAWCLLALSMIAVPSVVRATPRRVMLAARTAPPRVIVRRAVAPPPPPPPVALQLAGLRVMTPVAHAAVMHALARDAWPSLVRCVTPVPRVRGYANVEISERGRGLEVRLAGAPITRDPTLAECVRRAVSHVVLPPHEDEPPATSVAFDLAFGMPAIVAVARPRAQR